MTSSDLRDVLELPVEGQPGGSRAPPAIRRQQRVGATGRPSLKGLAREVQSLGGDNPIAIVPEVSVFKKRRIASRKPAARWDLRPFWNSARDDRGLILRHWRRVTEDNEASNPPASAPADGSDAASSGERAMAARAVEASLGEPEISSGEGGEGQTPQRETERQQPAELSLEDSAFAKFNVRVSLPVYTDDQYQLHLQSDNWTRDETDYLMKMAREFDLRWPLIWDRYEFIPPSTATPAATENEAQVEPAIEPTTEPTTEPKSDEPQAEPASTKPAAIAGEEATTGTGSATAQATSTALARVRSLEDLKARYYEVAAKTMAALRPVQYMSQVEFEQHERMANFNPDWERRRKEMASNALRRSREEAREEEALLLELRRMLLRSERLEEERRELYRRLDYPHTDQDIGPFKTSAGLQTLLQNLLSTDKNRKRRPLLGPEATNSPSTGMPPTAGLISAASTAAQDTGGGRRDSVATSAGGFGMGRDSMAPTQTPTSATSRKGGAGLPERRKLTEQEEAVYGLTHHERLGSGPTFRTEKINKLLSHKSNSQHTRIMNMLAELDVPPRLAMPTARVTAQFEQLLAAVNTLLDTRKMADKLDAEIRLEEARKLEREKAKALPSAIPAPAVAASTSPLFGDANALPPDSNGPGAEATTTSSSSIAHPSPIVALPNPAANMARSTAVDASGGGGDSVPVKAEHPSSSQDVTSHKRSASVLSQTSDKGPTKRQKKQ